MPAHITAQQTRNRGNKNFGLPCWRQGRILAYLAGDEGRILVYLAGDWGGGLWSQIQVAMMATQRASPGNQVVYYI
jgi:hypothetical protein